MAFGSWLYGVRSMLLGCNIDTTTEVEHKGFFTYHLDNIENKKISDKKK